MNYSYMLGNVNINKDHFYIKSSRNRDIIMNLSRFCCICIEVSTELVPIKETDAQDVKYSDKLSLCEPNQEWYENPFFICNTCKEELSLCYNFILKCQKSKTLRLQKLEEENVQEFLMCDLCKKSFRQKRFLKLHITRKHGVIETKNKVNEDEPGENKNKENNTDLTSDNIKQDHNDEYDENYTQSDDDEPLENLRIEKQKQYKKKVYAKRKKGPHSCEFCGKIFLRRQHWSAHIRANHTFEKIYKCQIGDCKASFINSHSLLVHTRNHKNEKPYVCSVCGKCFVCSGDLYHHSKIHENKREYECQTCHKRFNTTSILRTHKIVKHTDPKDWRYVCTMCDRRFPINSGLATHMKRHTGEKNFACMLCEKKFFNKAEVTKHLLSHSSEKLFKCMHCGEKAYKNREGLRKHLKTAHDIGNWKPPKMDKKFFCSMCSKVFNANNKLQRHLLTHTGERPFDCQYCQKKFVDNYARKVHLRKEHNIEEANEKTYVIPTSVVTFQSL